MKVSRVVTMPFPTIIKLLCQGNAIATQITQIMKRSMTVPGGSKPGSVVSSTCMFVLIKSKDMFGMIIISNIPHVKIDVCFEGIMTGVNDLGSVVDHSLQVFRVM